jgi:hypothetical protein
MRTCTCHTWPCTCASPSSACTQNLHPMWSKRSSPWPNSFSAALCSRVWRSRYLKPPPFPPLVVCFNHFLAVTPHSLRRISCPQHQTGWVRPTLGLPHQHCVQIEGRATKQAILLFHCTSIFYLKLQKLTRVNINLIDRCCNHS